MPNVTIKGSHTVTSYCDTFLDVMVGTVWRYMTNGCREGTGEIQDCGDMWPDW